MDIQIKETEPCKLSVHYTADAGEILNKRGEVLKHFKKAPVPGFRKGKSTLDAIKVHYRTQIEESLTRGLAEDAYHNTLFEKKLRPHGAPKFNSALMVDGKFVCDFDLIAVPWTDEAIEPFELVKEIENRIGILEPDIFLGLHSQEPEIKPHGRLAWLIKLGNGAALDISIMPRLV